MSKLEPQPEILALRQVHSGWSSMMVATLRLTNGAVIDRHIEHHGDGVAVLPYNPATGTVILISMLRAAVLYRGADDLLEVIAGGMHGETGPECVRREALEEAGVVLGPLEPVGSLWSMPQVSTDLIQLYLAAYNDEARVTEGGGVEAEQENITVHEMPAAAAWRLYQTGRLVDMKAVVLLQALRISQPGLFDLE